MSSKTIRCGALSALSIILLAATSSCGDDSGPPQAVVIPPAPPPPPPPPTYQATKVPFDLTASRTFDVFGWDDVSAPVPSATELRWNASSVEYELSLAGSSDWNRLRLLYTSQSVYDVFDPSGSRLPFQVILAAPDNDVSQLRHVGHAFLFDGRTSLPDFAFGMATAISDLPSSGTRICDFGEDEVGGGSIVINFSSGSVSGTIEPFWQNVVYELETTSYEASADVNVKARYAGSDDNLFEARFFGPGAIEIAVRSTGPVAGVMTGNCRSND